MRIRVAYEVVANGHVVEGASDQSLNKLRVVATAA